MYYPSNPVTEIMKTGDTLFLAKDRSGSLLFIVAPEDSASERQLSWLFDLKPEGGSFVSREFTDTDSELSFVARYILDEIGIEFKDPEADRSDAIIDEFGTSFPKTVDFSATARETLPEVKAEDDPDAALVAWLDREESLFRRLERRIVSERLEKGFVMEEGTDVDGFIAFSLSVQNRRKSRMGHSLENHIKAVLDAYHVIYEQGVGTENDHRPDFLFPGIDAYRKVSAGDSRLTMLGAKSSCKDRWRQVLAEANKIPRKHLLTLEPSISEPQTDQMRASDLQLVVPQSIHETYAGAQKTWLWSVRDFVSEVLERQERCRSSGL